MLIGEVERTIGISRDTVRYYEREGLIAGPPRLENNYKEYSVETVERLRFIRQVQELGFTLAEIRQLLSLADSGSIDCAAVAPHVKAKIEDIDAKIAALSDLRARLSSLSSECEATEPGGICKPLAQSLKGVV